jgi:hypothetical protein
MSQMSGPEYLLQISIFVPHLVYAKAEKRVGWRRKPAEAVIRHDVKTSPVAPDAKK